MPSIDVLNIQGKKVSTLKLNDEIFNVKFNEALVHSVIVNYLANQRQGTQSTKTRSEVSGGGKKPWRQKGTGRARHGSTRSPIWIKGGIALGPKPRSYNYRVNKKEKQNAIKMILSNKIAEKNIIVVDEIKLKEIKTKEVATILNNLKVDGKTLLLLEENNNEIYRAAKNINKLNVSYVGMTNAYQLLDNKQIVATEAAIKKLEEVLG